MQKERSYFSREREIERTEKMEQKQERKRRKIIKTSYEPLFPIVIQGFFRGMLIALPVVFLLEIIVTVEGKRAPGAGQFLVRSSTSLFYTWLFWGGITILLCIIQLFRVRYAGYEEKVYRYADEIPNGEGFRYVVVNQMEEADSLRLYAKLADSPAEERYKRMLTKTTLTGMLVILYSLSALF